MVESYWIDSLISSEIFEAGQDHRDIYCHQRQVVDYFQRAMMLQLIRIEVASVAAVGGLKEIHHRKIDLSGVGFYYLSPLI